MNGSQAQQLTTTSPVLQGAVKRQQTSQNGSSIRQLTSRSSREQASGAVKRSKHPLDENHPPSRKPVPSGTPSAKARPATSPAAVTKPNRGVEESHSRQHKGSSLGQGAHASADRIASGSPMQSERDGVAQGHAQDMPQPQLLSQLIPCMEAMHGSETGRRYDRAAQPGQPEESSHEGRSQVPGPSSPDVNSHSLPSLRDNGAGIHAVTQQQNCQAEVLAPDADSHPTDADLASQLNASISDRNAHRSGPAVQSSPAQTSMMDARNELTSGMVKQPKPNCIQDSKTSDSLADVGSQVLGSTAGKDSSVDGAQRDGQKVAPRRMRAASLTTVSPAVAASPASGPT